MRNTLGFHIVIAGYGLWLPGDDRGSWSTAWDDELGLIEPHVLHAGDPVRLRMARERMKHPPLRLTAGMMDIVAEVLGKCAAASDWDVAAVSIEATHVHMQLTYTPRDIDNTVKWLKDQMTKAIHKQTDYQGPVWCEGRWRGFIYDIDVWNNTVRYIERHNMRRGAGPRPYPFIVPVVYP